MTYETIQTFKHPANEKGKFIRELLQSNGDNFFHCQFIKKDGTIRDMTCRLGVKKYLKGGEFSGKEHQDLLPVFDTVKGEYRSISCSQVKSISMKGQRHEF